MESKQVINEDGMMDKLIQFETELKALIVKYNGCITHEYEGEGYSICNQEMVLYAGGKCKAICTGTEIDEYSFGE